MAEVLLLGRRSGRVVEEGRKDCLMLAEGEERRWSFGRRVCLLVLVLVVLDGDLWGLWGIGVMLRLLRGWLLIRTRP